MMILRTTDTSPFGRKPRMAALHLGLMDQMQILPADAMEADSALRAENPLGKMPVLTLADGRHVFDSRVILEHFDHLAGGGRIIPREWDARINALTSAGRLDPAILPAALLWTLGVTAFLLWHFLGKRDERRLLAELKAMYPDAGGSRNGARRTR